MMSPFPRSSPAIRSLVLSTGAALILLGATLTDAPRVFLVGDSTMSDKPVVDNPERGWGQVFPWFFKEGVLIENHARNGRSTRSFLAEGRWDTVLQRLRPGDYVFIQFGHNDAKVSDTTRFAPAGTTYRTNLVRFVREARERGGIPVLLTPVSRRSFDSSGAFVDRHGDYPGTVREVAAELSVPLIDLHKTSVELLQRLGPEQSIRLFLWTEPGEYRLIPQGKRDNTHFTKRGAIEFASMVATGIRESALPLSAWLSPRPPDAHDGLEKIVGLDYYYNCEWKRRKEGDSVRYHYTWEDTANSGFSLLGVIIDRLGSTIATVPGPATAAALRTLDVYVIVDPDTPLESSNPHTISSEDASAIESWVHEGGVLLLLGNDKGNAEFDRLNMLATRFGIRFNEDSHHRVVGNDFALGTTMDLPSHPVFAGVRQIYTKEVASLSIARPAEAFLSEGGRVLMAASRVGKGLVVAVGDPWLYNEYIDTRKLPAGYDNARAGENLFRWLLMSSRQPRQPDPADYEKGK